MLAVNVLLILHVLQDPEGVLHLSLPDFTANLAFFVPRHLSLFLRGHLQLLLHILRYITQ